jgi:glycosyltransferase involved in cell wall biosynthesis
VTLVTSDARFPSSYRLRAGLTRLSIEGIDVRVLRVPYSNRMSYARRMRAFVGFSLRATGHVLTGGPYDVVFATSTPLTVAVPGILAKLRHRAPLVFEVRDLWPALPEAMGALRNPLLRWAARALEKTTYRASSGIVALSPGMAEGVRQQGTPPGLIHVIPNACDPSFRVGDEAAQSFLDEHPYLAGGPLVVYTGALGPANGVSYLAEVASAALALDPDVRFLVVGDGREREAIRARAQELGVLERNFWMLPPVAKSRVPAILAAASLPTTSLIDLAILETSSPNKFFDALAAGRPVMVNYEGWVADLVRDTGAGIVAPRGDPAAAARMVVDLVRDPVRLREAGAAAARLGRERFDRDALAHELRVLLEDVARGHCA